MQKYHTQQNINKLVCIIETRYGLDLELLALAKDIQIDHNGTRKYCRNIKNHGSCIHGDDCWFRHTFRRRCRYDMSSLGCDLVHAVIVRFLTYQKAVFTFSMTIWSEHNPDHYLTIILTIHLTIVMNSHK